METLPAARLSADFVILSADAGERQYGYAGLHALACVLPLRRHHPSIQREVYTVLEGSILREQRRSL